MVEMIKKKPKKPMYRSFIRIIDKSKEPVIDEDGRKGYYTKWVEIFEDVNLGSIKNPNKDILELKIVPIDEEGENDSNEFRDFLSRFGIG